MASSHQSSKPAEKKRVECRLVDTTTKQVHSLEDGGRLLIVSHAHLENLEGYDHAHRTLHLSPSVDRDIYCAEVLLQEGKGTGLVAVHKGTCYVNGEEVREGEKPRKVKNGTFLDMGASYQFQFVSSKLNDTSPVKRVLPQTPGQPTNEKPPSKPPRHHVTKAADTETVDAGSDTSYSYCGSIDLEQSTIDEGKRSRLKRIAKEIASRSSGYQDRKPPPPYEQVGNSIGYQLLHQNHKDVTAKLIDVLYPALKELELKGPELTATYSSYITDYANAREAGATPQCMLPGDIPTINFIADILVSLCCMPHMVSLSEKYAPLFAHILAIFSSSYQNQLTMAEQRHTTKVLSCMNLTIMSNAVEFQQHGWTFLANTLATPTPAGKKPLLSEASLTLALNQIEHQLNVYNLELDLSLAIIRFLSVVASTAKRCTVSGGKDEAPPIYTPTQANSIINLLNETKVLRHVMKVPQDIRSDPDFQCHYSVVVKCLAPKRGKRKAMLRRGTTSELLQAQSASPSPPVSQAVPSSIPPPKPKRLFRNRRSTFGARSHGGNDNKSKKAAVVNKDGQGHLSTSLTVGSGHVTVPDDHMTSPVVSNEEELEESNDLNTSEVSSELDLHCTQSCSALPDNVNYEHDINFPQSISAPVLPQRQREKPVKPESLQVSEPHQIDQGGSVKPQPEPVKPDWKKIEERELPPNEPEESEIHQSAQDELSQENLVIQQNQQREHLSPSADLENADTTGSPWRQKKEPVKLESSLQDLEEQMKLELSQQKQDEPVDTKLDLEESELPNGTEEDLGSISAAIAPGVQKVCQVVLEEPVKPVSSRQGEGEGINHELLHEDQEEPQANQGELIKPAERVKESEGSEKAFRDDVRVAADTDRTSNAVADHSPSVDVFQRETSTSSELAEGDTPPTVEANSNQDSFALGQLPPATVSTGEDTLTRHIAGEVEASLSGHESTNHSMVPQAEEEGGGEVLPVEASQQDDTVPCEVDSSVTVPPAKERVSDVTSLRVSDPSLSSKLENKELHPSHNDSPSKPHPSHSDSHSSASPSEPHPSLSEPHPSPGEPYLSPGEPHPSPSDSHSELPLERTLKILEERSQALVESLSSPLTSSPAMPHESLDASESSPPPGDDSSASLRLVSLHSDSSPKAEHCTSADITVTSNDRGDSERILLEPPWSPGTEALASDIQNLLSVVQAPLAANQVVKVPSISRNNRYYRVSVKGSTPKSRDSTPKAVRRNLEDEMEKVQRDEDDDTSKGGESWSDRPQWRSATPPSAVRGHAETAPFEVSGEFLSTTHQVIEDITSGHQDMKESLLGRLEVASGVVTLWHKDKGLQASTNLVQACFSSGRDAIFFIDVLQQFLKHQSPWTLAVCFVLLPVLRQLITTQTDERCVGVVCDVLHMIIKRFSELILFSKGKSRAHASRRLSSTMDREQQEVCYNELYNIRKSLHSRLDLNSDPVSMGNLLRKLHAALKPFKEPLDD